MRFVAALLCALPGTVALSAPPARGAVRPCTSGLVALTFDDGPAAAVTGRLLDVLVARRVPATFFVVGQRVAAAPALVRRAHRAGFVVANHSYRHEMLTRLSSSGVRQTLVATNRAIRNAGAVPAPLMRPPYGAIDSRVRSVATGLGLTPVLWDVDPRDWQSGTPGQIAGRVLSGLRPGGRNIVLLHDGVGRSGTTLEAVPAIVRGARERGYCFAALGASGRPLPPVPAARVGGAVVTEVDPGRTTRLRFTVRLDRPTSRSVSLRVRTVAGTASEGMDFRAVDRRIRFPVGVTVRRVLVTVLGDRIDETRERLRLRLDRPRGVKVADAAGTGVIRDDDPPPQLRLLDAGVVEPTEGSTSARVAVRLSRPSSRRVDVRLATAPQSADASDYTAVDATVGIPAGRTGAALLVPVLADLVDEEVETLEVVVVATLRATVGDGRAVVTILPPPEEPPDEPPAG